MLIKVCLFLFAGEMIYKFHKHKVDEFDGIGKIMPVSTWAYTFASLGLVGIPMTAGYSPGIHTHRHGSESQSVATIAGPLDTIFALRTFSDKAVCSALLGS